jgi:acyl carrier protein phosphodiesterase
MNFLAHLYLSGENEGIRLGNFFADAVKGNKLNRFPDDVRDGIRLHRRIDSFTDTHPIVLQGTKRLQPNYGKFSGIIIDLYYDYYLASSWDSYCDIPLRKYTQDAYKMLIRNYFLLPDRSRRILPFMITYNWLEGYSKVKGMQQVFEGMSRRTRFPAMRNAMEDLDNYFDEFKAEFEAFFPEIIEDSRLFINSLAVNS